MGIAVSVIPASAVVLSHYGVLAATLPQFVGTVITAFLVRQLSFAFKQTKFAHISFWVLWVWAALFAQTLIFRETPWVALCVLSLTAILSDMHRWSIAELCIRHLNPVAAERNLSLTIIWSQVGIVVGAGLHLFQLMPIDFSLALIITLACNAFFTVVIRIIFADHKNVEIRYSKKAETPSLESKLSFAKAWRNITILIAFYGVFRVGHDFWLKLNLNTMLNTEQLKSLFAQIFVITSLSIVVGTWLLQKLYNHSRWSPIPKLKLSLFLNVFFFGLTLAYPTQVFPFAILAVWGRFQERVFYGNAVEQLIQFFEEGFRAIIRSGINFYQTLLGALALVALHFMPMNASAIASAIGLLGALIFVYQLEKPLVHFFEYIITHTQRSANKTMAILSVRALSYFRPSTYLGLMEKILESQPKKLLRKTVVLSIAHAHEARADDIILKQFHSDKEEISLAVIDALAMRRSYTATQFILKILMEKVHVNSQRVKTHAALFIASVYGKKAIPVLLNGLESDDPRVISNSLEVLAEFKDKKLIPTFKRFLNSDEARIKANALYALYSFKNEKLRCLRRIRKILESGNQTAISSVFFMVGKHQIQELQPILLKYKKDNFITLAHHSNTPRLLSLKRTLAFALTCLGHREGFQLFYELIHHLHDPNEIQDVFHFFAQVPALKRYEFFDFFGRRSRFNPDFLTYWCKHMKESTFDFHEEIEYCEVLIAQIPAHPQSQPTQNPDFDE